MKHLKLFFALFAMLALGVTNAWAEEYELYSGTITEGDYLIVYNNGAMNTTVSSSRLGYTTVSPSGNIITDPAETIVWHIAPSGDYWTIYNAKVNKYAASTGAKNKAQLLASGTDAKSLWTVTGSSKYEFVNKQNTTNNVNKNLRRNDTYGFACYATSTGGALSLYKKVENAGATTTKPVIPGSQEFETETFTVELSAEEGAAIYYTLNGDEPTAASTPYTAAFTINATTTVKAIAVKDGVSSAVASATYTKVNVITGKTCAEAAALCTTTTGTTDKYQVVGYVTSIVTAYDASFGNISFWMADTKDGGKVLQGYRVKPTNDADKAVKVGDKVQVTGKLKKYNSTPEFNTGVYTITEVAPVYDVTIVSEHGDVTATPMSGIEGTEVTLTVEAASGWVFDSWTVKDASDNEVTATENKFNIPASDVTVTANYKASEAAKSKLCLSANEVVTTNEYRVGETVDLPETIENTCIKQFVGWSAAADCTTEPEYAPGAEFTLTEESHTLYAVYATAKTGDSMNAVYTETFASCKGTGGNDGTWSGSVASSTLTLTGWTLSNGYAAKECAKFGTGSKKGSAQTPAITLDGDATLTFKAGAWNGGSETTTLNISATGATLDQSSVTMKKGEWTEFTVAVTDVTGPVQIKFEAKNASNNRFFLDEVVVSQAAIEFTEFSTTCSAALANPTFSLAEGKYTEAKSVEIEYTEGTVYYTLDGTEPTASSTKYTGAIALNECGEYTIKAIAISDDSQSEVVKATYTIKLPLTNSQAAPYTEAEAIAVYKGGCYDNQDVYVKGTVKSAAFNSTYGNYTITLTDGFQFYQFHKEAGKVKFTEDIIVPGDVLIACGKLSDYEGNCQLAAGCYLVERIPYEGEKTDISNTEATAYTVDQAFALIADVASDLNKEVYVKGLVAVAPTSNPTDAGKMTYSISDNGEKTGKVLKIYLGLGIDGAKFTSKNDVKLGDYVVVKGKLLDYSGTYELTDNQLVSLTPSATITIDNITMEVGETKTIAATITPAEATVSYSIKENAASAILLDGTTITANAVGTATITATIATAAEYMGKTVEFTVTVTPKTEKEKVVILAQHEGQWYAMMAQYVSGKTSHLAALPVTYFDGKLYNVDEEDKALIEWDRAVVDGKATFSNNGKYVKGGANTNLTIAANQTDAYQWIWKEANKCYTTNASGTVRTFLYNGEAFRNFAVSNAGKTVSETTYSSLPVVTAPVYTIGDVTYTRATTAGKFGTICLPFGSTNYNGAEFFEFVGSETGKVYIGSVDELVAGVPYIFLASADQVVVTSDGTTAATPSNSNGLYGTFTNDTEVAIGNYILKDNALCLAEAICWVNAYRAYIVMNKVPTGVPQQMPGRRYIGMSVQGENGETGFENITAPAGKTVKAIVNGQLIIIRDGEMYNAQGQLIK